MAGAAAAGACDARHPSPSHPKWWKEERHGVFVDYNQNAKDRTVAAARGGPAPETANGRRAWAELPVRPAESR